MVCELFEPMANIWREISARACSSEIVAVAGEREGKKEKEKRKIPKRFGRLVWWSWRKRGRIA